MVDPTLKTHWYQAETGYDLTHFSIDWEAEIEGVHSQGIRAMGLRRSRYIGLHKTHLDHIAPAAAMNVIQLTSWLRGEAPAQTRTSPFKKVMKQAA